MTASITYGTINGLSMAEIADAGGLPRTPHVRTIARFPSEQHDHGVFTERLPSDHGSGRRGSYVCRQEV